MDELNEMARLHSAGAIVMHESPFSSLTAFRNQEELPAGFIQKWVIPFYMEICSYANNEWVQHIKDIKPEIDHNICRALLGDFNWRTRLTGAYFAAVKGYDDLIEIIGTHLLKSEVCCVGHIYALVLAFFNNPKTIDYLDQYLAYYLRAPSLYFDQEKVLEALLFTDKENGTAYFNKHQRNWELLLQERKTHQKQSVISIANMLEISEGKLVVDNEEEQPAMLPDTSFFDKQVALLRELHAAH